MFGFLMFPVQKLWPINNKMINTLRAAVRNILTSISALNQQLSVALPTP